MSERYKEVKDLSQNSSESADFLGFIQNRDLAKTKVSLYIRYMYIYNLYTWKSIYIY